MLLYPQLTPVLDKMVESDAAKRTATLTPAR